MRRLALVLAACAGGEPEPDPRPLPPVDAQVVAPRDAAVPACDDKLAAVRDGLVDGHPCKAWLEKTYPRVVSLAHHGSGVVWSLDTKQKTGVLLSAAHVFQHAPGMYELEVKSGFFDPDRIGEHPWIACAPQANGVTKPKGPGVMMLYWPGSKEVDAYGWNTILPEDDYMFAVLAGSLDTTNCQSSNWQPDLALPWRDRPRGAPELPGLDPKALVTAAPVPGERALIVGYPEGHAQSYIVARVLSDADAKRRIAELAAAGDEEGVIPYSAKVEILLDGYAKGGTSGGGVFDTEGRLVAILVRGSRKGPATIRAVRASYILEQMRTAWPSAPKPLAKKLVRYLDPSLTP